VRPERAASITLVGNLSSATNSVAYQSQSLAGSSTSVYWTGSGDGVNWTDPANWSGDFVPTEADDVTINAPGSLTVQIASGSQAVHSLTSTCAVVSRLLG
jgi:hypothetical protein